MLGPVVSYRMGKCLQIKSVLRRKASCQTVSVQTTINAMKWMSVSCAIERRFSQLRLTSSESFETGGQFKMPDSDCKRSVSFS